MSTQYENLIRILGNDIPGEKKTLIGLTQIRGIGYMFANAMLQILKINPDSRIGTLSEDEVSSIEKMIQDPKSQNFPIWFLNRQKDIETGDDMHLVTSDIAFQIRNDVEREKGVFSWRGYRHMYGLKVRGQRTRCTGRKGGAVGVAKGGSLNNAVVVQDNKILNKEGLRNKLEFVNHKILDCIGDLYLSGYKIIGSLKCSQGGHQLTNNALRKVFENKENYSIIEIKEKYLPHTLINKSYLKSIA